MRIDFEIHTFKDKQICKHASLNMLKFNCLACVTLKKVGNRNYKYGARTEESQVTK